MDIDDIVVDDMMDASGSKPAAPAEPIDSPPRPPAKKPRKPRQTGLYGAAAHPPAPKPPPADSKRQNRFKRKNRRTTARPVQSLDDLVVDQTELVSGEAYIDPLVLEKTGVGGGVPQDKTGHTPPRGYLESTRLSPEALAAAMTGLTVRQRLFLQSYMLHGNREAAIRAAGYTGKYASDQAWGILNSPRVKPIMATLQQNVAEKIEYNLEAAMREAHESMVFAKETENATAHVKAVELRAKLNGLVIDKHDIRAVGAFTVQIHGIERKPQESLPTPTLPSVIKK